MWLLRALSALSTCVAPRHVAAWCLVSGHVSNTQPPQTFSSTVTNMILKCIYTGEHVKHQQIYLSVLSCVRSSFSTACCSAAVLYTFFPNFAPICGSHESVCCCILNTFHQVILVIIIYVFVTLLSGFWTRYYVNCINLKIKCLMPLILVH